MYNSAPCTSSDSYSFPKKEEEKQNYKPFIVIICCIYRDYIQCFDTDYIDEISEAINNFTNQGIFPKVTNIDTGGDGFVMVISARSATDEEIKAYYEAYRTKYLL